MLQFQIDAQLRLRLAKFLPKLMLDPGLPRTLANDFDLSLPGLVFIGVYCSHFLRDVCLQIRLIDQYGAAGEVSELSGMTEVVDVLRRAAQPFSDLCFQ